MNVTQSLKHIKWRFSSDKIVINDKDIEAFNNIVAYVSLSEQKVLEEQRLFTKLFTYILTFNSKYYGNNVKKVLNDIEDHIKKPLYKCILGFKYNIPQCNLIQLWKKHDNIYVTVNDPPTPEDLEKIQQAHKKQMALFQEELKNSLKSEYTEQQLTEFITKKVTELVTLYKNYD